ncbi:hypothetical protein IWW48_002147 [Coemansia sp. RSA 1200]|nr:hypothetical protein IWW48_002147 [Coemansia sp. RSA 1200]
MSVSSMVSPLEMLAECQIRKDSDWARHLSNKEKRQSWLKTSAEKFNTTAGDMDYIFNELEYYKILQENTPQNMVLGGADMVWFKDIPDYDSLTFELKQYVVVLEAAYPKILVNQEEGGRVLRLIDPLLYPLDYELTHVLSSPIESPEQALNVETFGDRPESFKAWTDIHITRGVSVRANADFWNALDQGIVYTEPVPKMFTKPDRPLPLLPTYSLRGEELQVVIGMETIYLTSENPKHGESEWQNSGNLNDKIVATAIWYYDVENVDISDIQFRDPVGTYEQHNMIVAYWIK